jgi:hypothetical protein
MTGACIRGPEATTITAGTSAFALAAPGAVPLMMPGMDGGDH